MSRVNTKFEKIHDDGYHHDYEPVSDVGILRITIVHERGDQFAKCAYITLTDYREVTIDVAEALRIVA